MKIWNLKDTVIGFKLETKNNPKEIAKIGISNPKTCKRYDEHLYHFTT